MPHILIGLPPELPRAVSVMSIRCARVAHLRGTARRSRPCGKTPACPGNSALMRRYCCIIGVIFSVGLALTAAALISFGTIVMVLLWGSAFQVQHSTASGGSAARRRRRELIDFAFSEILGVKFVSTNSLRIHEHSNDQASPPDDRPGGPVCRDGAARVGAGSGRAPRATSSTC